MNEKEKFKAEIAARLGKCDKGIREIETKLKECGESKPECDIDSIIRKYGIACEKLDDADKADENAWDRLKKELDGLTGDIDKDIRRALARF